MSCHAEARRRYGVWTDMFSGYLSAGYAVVARPDGQYHHHFNPIEPLYPAPRHYPFSDHEEEYDESEWEAALQSRSAEVSGPIEPTLYPW